MAGAVLCWIAGRFTKTGRDWAVIAVTALELGVLGYFFTMPDLTLQVPWVCGLGLTLTLDGFRRLYTLIGGFMWLVSALASPRYFRRYRRRNRYYFFFLLTLGATVGVFLAADLTSVFLFFEIMSLASYVWVAQDERRESLRAGDTYLAVSVVGGLVMLMGLLLLSAQAQTQTTRYIAGFCLLFGFGAKAGSFPLHIWLPKAHPVAPAPASALLSGILTKAGIFGVLMLSTDLFRGDQLWGRVILYLGCATMVLGAVLAVFSMDLKRTLACSSVSQIGFILVGIGVSTLLRAENALAARGALLHMVNHSLIKLVLFLAAGVVFQNIHKLDLNEIRGFGRGKPLLHFVFLMGALGVGGIPLWNGYVSKTLLHEAILELGYPVIEPLFLLSGGLTLAYMGKLYVTLFWQRNQDPACQARFDGMRQYMDPAAAFGLTVSALLLPLLGAVPNRTADRVADFGQAFLAAGELEHRVRYFSWENLQGALISVVIGLVVYLVVIRLCRLDQKDRWPWWLDLEDLVYRPVLTAILPVILGTLSRILDRLMDSVIVLLRKTVYRETPIPHELEEGNAFTYAVGGFLDRCAAIFHNRTNYRHKLAMLYDDISQNGAIIGGSLSFGLFMTSVGLILILVYLLV
ncbi:MAG: sodium:proton antiporter [Oscillospiraceae bacterium]|nr:sodium:proton antiporter [Oscillospiraceae bacterium]